MAIIKAWYIQRGKSVSIKIATMVIKNEKKLETLSHKFNKEVRVIEWAGGNTYYLKSNSRIKSSSLDELFEMFKEMELGFPVRKRECSMLN